MERPQHDNAGPGIWQDEDANGILEGLIAAVRQWATGAAQNDDVTALIIRYRG